MAQIIPKLNLNKTPSLVESNSLIFAKNIRLDVDTTIHRDYGIMPMSIHKGNYTSDLVNYKTILKRIISDIKHEYETSEFPEDHYIIAYNHLMWISGKTISEGDTIIAKNGEANIVGIIPDSNDFYIFIHGTYESDLSVAKHNISMIIQYSEREDRFIPCNCNWSYSGGNIDGCIVNNLVGDKILNIGETSNGTLVPLKSINLKISNIEDDETIYTQIPNIPITNLDFAENFSCVIPNGVYQFFVRYRIKDDFYTNWFPASSEIFVGNKNSIITSFGTLQYTNTHRDSDNSFILSVEHLIEKHEANYKDFQIGFILSHDDAIYARAWKHFSFSVKNINFDYKASDAIEIEVIDLLKTTYGLYNVGNITSFKNKLYISNYTETDFNEDLQEAANKIKIDIISKEGGNTYDNYPIKETTVANKPVISGLIVNGTEKLFYGDNGIFKEIMSYRPSDSTSYNISMEEAITNALNGTTPINSYSPDKYSIRIINRIDSLDDVESEIRKTYKNINNPGQQVINYSFIFNPNIDNITFNGIEINKSDVLSKIYNTPRYLNDNCKWINSSGSLSDTITININRTCEVTEHYTYYGSGGLKPYDPSVNPIDPINPELNRPGSSSSTIVGGNTTTSGTRTFNVIYTQTIEIQFVAWNTKLNKNDSSTLINYTTLIPYQKYKFYIHFVKASGEITNGYYCREAGELTAPYMASCSILYPRFSNITIPTGYSACFFSICHTAINTATVFNIENHTDNLLKRASCFDINMMLMSGNKQIHIKQVAKITSTVEPNTSIVTTSETANYENTSSSYIVPPTIEQEIETFSGNFYYSGDASNSKFFGADGIITFDKLEFNNDRLAYAIENYFISETENIELIKCTPYLRGIKSYNDNSKMNLLGYICDVSPLDRERCMQYYSDGSSVYYKDASDYDEQDMYLHLDELYKYNDSSIDNNRKLSNFGFKESINKTIYSNYNLNYISLSEEPKISIKTYYNRPANSTTTSSEKDNIGNSILFRLIPSQLMSDIYTLPSMYKTYTRKTFSVYRKNETNVFNNTVRSSILYGDENKINILTFDANDYYNIPTNRGNIINLISVGDAILVHTRDSMFKFSGSNTLNSSNGEILTNESKPFDTGVSEIFGSDFGFAGIQYKSDHIVTENGYIFFDRDSRIVYMYSGNGQIVKLSDSIEKLFRHRKIDHIIFANDYYNNRFFMSIMFYENYTTQENEETVVKQKYYPVTLSFNISEQVKSFVSLHDFYYHYAFNTKTNCYFLTSDNKDICTIDKHYLGCYSKLELVTDNIYPNKFSYNNIIVKDEDNTTSVSKQLSIKLFNSIVDVITNENFELIKTLNAINWCGKIINSEFKNITSNDETTTLMAEDITYNIPCRAIMVYSDTCMSPICDTSNKANDKFISALDYPKYPFYNQGIWTFNYFRNILNSKGHKENYSGDNNSLIEGKYFVVRFFFDEAFKLETLSLNYNIKH